MQQDLDGRCLPLQRPRSYLACASIVSFSFEVTPGHEARDSVANFFGPFFLCFS